MSDVRLSLWRRLDARDRDLFVRWVLDEWSSPGSTRLWRTITHIGGLRASVAAVLLPFLSSNTPLRAAALGALSALAASHLVVQLVKRSVMRARPIGAVVSHAHVTVPDCFSFPSGHSCAAMSVAFEYGLAFPPLAAPLVLLASVVGFSRVRLGVHYPGDVLAGQVIAIATVLVQQWLR
ncbi:MAG: hypothetical protein RL139_38 [Gemmatimonadota bacterium]|jgi:undecaprenyl-diphosphatase